VELLDATTRTVLEVLAYAARRGTPLRRDEIEQYSQAPTRILPRTSTTWFPGVSKVFDVLASKGTTTTTPGESVIRYLLTRRIIVENAAGKLIVTALGATLLDYVEERQAASEGVLAVELRPGDPLAGAEVFMSIKNVGPCLIVDPYCREQQLLDLLRHTEASRLLRSKSASGDLTMLVQMAPRPFEVRETDFVHDRYVIPDAGPVLMLGVSLNGLGGKPSVLVTLPEDLSDSVRAQYEDVWRGATTLQLPEQEAIEAP
jgi:hypothetical protein